MTIIGIMLSVALLTAVASMFFSARESLIQYEISKKGDYHFCYQELTLEEAEEIAQNRKVEQTYLSSDLGYSYLEGIQNEDKPYVYVKTMTADAIEHLGLTLLEGRMPQDDTEILVPSHLKTNGRLTIAVGETISLEIGRRVSTEDGTEFTQNNPYFGDGAETITDTTVKEYTVVGIIERPASEMEGYSAPGYTFITYMDAPVGTDTVDVYAKYTKEGIRDAYGVTANILDIDAEAFRTVNSDVFMTLSEDEQTELLNQTAYPRYDYSTNHYLIQLQTGIIKDNTLASLGSACVVVVIIIIVTSVFCIKNSFDISITEKIRQYGMLSSVGATRKQIKKNVYYEAMVLGLIGTPLGLVLGHLASAILIFITNHMLFDMLNLKLIFTFSLAAIVAAVVLGFVTLLLSARRSARKASKVSPIQAIRNSEDLKISAQKVRTPKLIRSMFGIGGEIANKNLKRSKKKYRTTVVSITICVTVFVALSSFVNLGYEVLQTELTAYDYNVSAGYVNTEGNYDRAKQVRQLENIKQISVVTNTYLTCYNGELSRAYTDLYPEAGKPYTDASGELQEYNDFMILYMLDEPSFRDYVEELHLNYDNVKDKGILLNTIYGNKMQEDSSDVTVSVTVELDKYNFKKGDVIEGALAMQGEENVYDDMDVEIAAITDELPFGVYSSMYDAVLIVSDCYAQQVFASETYDMIYIDAENPDQIQDQMEKIFEDTTTNIYNVAENAKTMRSLLSLVGIFLYGFIIVISLIGVTNIFNTITTNMNLRRREFAMLKSIGMTKREFNRMVQLESLFYGMKSLIIGLPLGCVISFVIYKVMMEGELVLQYHLPIGAMLISALAVFVLITCIMRYSIRKIGKQNMIETIRNENI